MWVAIALAASFFQTARNALARSLADRVSPALNSWSRFTFNLPLSMTVVMVLFLKGGRPAMPVVFYSYCALTAATQLLGNVALVAAFNRANFAQSIVLHKLEVVFTAVLGVALFSEHPSVVGWAGCLTCGAGVVLINLGRERGPAGWRRAFHLDAGSLLALTCGLLLVLASFMLKEANSVFVIANPRVGTGRFEAAAFTLFHTTWIETAILTLWLVAVRPKQFRHVRAHWKRMALIGFTGFGGSLCWFWAYSLTLVAYVKAVGQVEAVLAVVLAVFLWREREVFRQIPGVIVVLAGIGLVLFG